jgi:diadenosine tetraphosphate (Ap4A) HIT family hydrolase
MTFELHPSLAKKIFLAEFPLCSVLLEDEGHYPWLFLVPRRKGVSRMMDLTESDQLQLLKELDYVQKVMWEEFQPTQLNVAAIGNKIPQLHVHVIARRIGDPAWPNTVWDHPVRMPYDESLRGSVVERLQFLLAPMSLAVV